MFKLEIAKGLLVMGLLIMMISNLVKYYSTEISCSADDNFGQIIEPAERRIGVFLRSIIILLLIVWTSL